MRDREMSHRECETPESHKRALEISKSCTIEQKSDKGWKLQLQTLNFASFMYQTHAIAKCVAVNAIKACNRAHVQ